MAKRIVYRMEEYRNDCYRYEMEIEQKDVDDIINDFNEMIIGDERVPSMTVQEFYDEIINGSYDNFYNTHNYKIKRWDRDYEEDFVEYARDYLRDCIWDYDNEYIDGDCYDTEDEFWMEGEDD